MGQNSPEIDPHKYNQLIFGKRVMAIKWSEDSLLTKVMGKGATSRHQHAKKKEKR